MIGILNFLNEYQSIFLKLGQQQKIEKLFFGASYFFRNLRKRLSLFGRHHFFNDSTIFGLSDGLIYFQILLTKITENNFCNFCRPLLH